MSPAARWIGGIVLLLAGNAVAVILLATRSGDPTPRTVPDAYRRAVAYDRTVAARAASDALGWRAEPHLVAAGRGDRLEVALLDRRGAPVAGAQVEASVRHRSRATGPTVALVETAPGRYAAAVTAQGRGLHDVEVHATRGADRFLAARTLDLEAAP